MYIVGPPTILNALVGDLAQARFGHRKREHPEVCLCRRTGFVETSPTPNTIVLAITDQEARKMAGNSPQRGIL